MNTIREKSPAPTRPANPRRNDLRLWRDLQSYYRCMGCEKLAAMAQKQAERIVEERAYAALARCRAKP